MTTIEFILGPKDGEIYEYPDPLPPAVRVLCLPKFDWAKVREYNPCEIVKTEFLQYDRIGDTANYICKNPPKPD